MVYRLDHSAGVAGRWFLRFDVRFDGSRYGKHDSWNELMLVDQLTGTQYSWYC